MNEIKIKKISLKDFNLIENLLKNYAFKELFFLKEVSESKKIKLNLQKLKILLTEENNFLIGAFKNNNFCGILAYSQLCWDSKFYNFNCGKLELVLAFAKLPAEKKEILNKLISCFLKFVKQKNINWITVRINTKDLNTLHQLQNFKFKLMTTEIWFMWKKSKHYVFPLPKTKLKVCSAEKKHIKELLKFAKYFNTNRTYLEENISPNKKLSMYKNWIKNSILNKFSGQDEVLVGLNNENEVIAFTTAKLDDSPKNILGYAVGYPGLVAVKENYRGKNINQYLMGKAMESLFKKTPYCLAPSHISNLKMIASESKTNPDIVNSEYILHYWNLRK